MPIPVPSATPIASLPVRDFTVLICRVPTHRHITAGSQDRLIRRLTISNPATAGRLTSARSKHHPIDILPGLLSCHCRERGLPVSPRPLRRKKAGRSRRCRDHRADWAAIRVVEQAHPGRGCSCDQRLRRKKSAPDIRGACSRLANDRYAAFWLPITVGPLALPLIGIERGFFASGISRTKSTCKRPFSRLAPFTRTKSASWNTRSKVRAAMP